MTKMESKQDISIPIVSLVIAKNSKGPQFTFNWPAIISHQRIATLIAELLTSASENNPMLNIAETINEARMQLICPSLTRENQRKPIISELVDPGTFNRLYEIDLPENVSIEYVAEIMLCLFYSAQTKNPKITLEELGDAFIEHMQTSRHTKVVTKGPPQ